MDGNKLKELRESNCLSREEFADKMGVDISDVENWEEYGYEPTKYNIERMADALNVDEDSLKWKLNVDRKIDEDDTTDIGLGGLLLGIAAIWGLGKLTNRNKKETSEYEDINYEYDELEDDDDEDEEEFSVPIEEKVIRNEYGTVTIETKKKTKEKDNSLIIVFGMFLLLFFIIGSILLSFHIKEKQAIEEGKVSVGFYRDFKGEDYEVVVEQLKVLGFTNIKLIDLNDSGIFFWNNGKIDSISIGGNSTFESLDFFHPDEVVIISYH